ncbi:MAG: TIGR02266 family protein [Kofleriaceae bacterium]
MADPNTRQGKRTPVTLKIKFKSETLEQFIERYAVDVSQGGIFIRTKEPLAVGTQMRFEFQLRDASPLIGGEGTVVWTRENDPSRPAIAPGMGVRFDRLAEGSQTVLERILAEKAKQAPQRSTSETAKPPMFTDTPTRVAPAPVQDALLGSEQSQATRRGPGTNPSGFGDQHTPLPKPMPFHSDADEFPEEAFEEATKVRALDELVAQTALVPKAGETSGSDDLASRRGKDAFDPGATLESGPVPRPIVDPGGSTRDSAPGLPLPPDPPADRISAKLATPRLLDTSPSPRSEEPLAGKTKLGVEPARSNAPSSPPVSARSSSVRAISTESSAATRIPAAKSSAAPLVILILLLLAAGAGAVWFFVFRDRAVQDNTVALPTQPDPGSAGSAGSAIAINPGSNGPGSNQPGSNGPGSNQPGSAQPVPQDLVDTVIAVPDLKDKATIEVVGTDQKGPAPFTAKLEKDKPYTVKVTAAGFVAADLEIKGGDKPEPVKLVAKPRVLKVTSDPDNALIMIDGMAPKGAFTPFEIVLTKAQAGKKMLRVRVQKMGFRAAEKVVETSTFVEGDTQVATTVKFTLAKAAPVIKPPPGNGSAGSAAGSGSDTPGSASTPAGSGSATPAPPEPEPEFVPPKTP